MYAGADWLNSVGRSFGPTREGRRSRPPRVSQLWVKFLVSTRHHWADIFIVRRQGPDGLKGSTNSTATCSTWRELGSARLYFAQDSPCDDNTQPYRIGRRQGQQGPRLPPYTKTEVSSVLLVHHRRFQEETARVSTSHSGEEHFPADPAGYRTRVPPIQSQALYQVTYTCRFLFSILLRTLYLTPSSSHSNLILNAQSTMPAISGRSAGHR